MHNPSGANCKQTVAVLCDVWHHSMVCNARPGEALGRNAAQAVTDSVKRFAKHGWDAPMEEWKKCKTSRVRTATFIPVTQTESLESQSEVSDVTGWLHIWEIADVEKFPSDPDMMSKLLRFVSDCPSQPSDKPELAADRELQYDYRKNQVTKHSVVRSSEVAAKSETTTVVQGFHEAKDAINAEAHAMPKSTKTKSMYYALRHRVVLWKTTKRFEESALDVCCERNKVNVAESSQRSRKSSGTN